ncbi:carboxy-S-adenosyl-L-methionine synthase CmoA [Sulfurospirillum sp. hDNRA2]|uniref:carboxy-S-adenosyl-L-methionine synthase CmoA n=1 Tax=Sulfurospirillum sp. hDNRA2 TaxID=3237298 RepID=UPI0020B8EF4A|nr:carboxy-S-adenosyl-L-methionine synthase CmoA [Sulfurospirillum sp. DNRA8]MCP3651005.1 carboxy-S-adenosyl-L-methionine synthase CmoA [Sulfurospirillum sp. DNRA8]MCR1809851.1 carboxy-S-adenosyl-L-methionine synthase CmoA [Sulfurospirillum sp. DNRA8]
MDDTLFSKPISKQFEFDEDVAVVFDDMLERSIPFYKEVIELTCDCIVRHVSPCASIVDLGCSTANTLLTLYKKSDKSYRLLGVDNSEAMLHLARQKVHAYGAQMSFLNADITEVALEPHDAIIANYMLQFIRPLQRSAFVQKLYDALKPQGIFLLSEKIVFDDKVLNKQMIDVYYDFKRKQGYSDFEIAQKREALENVLIPYTEQENKAMLEEVGFETIETLFKWGNFATFIAKKKG